MQPCSAAVSYTHLDVYKRQVLSSAELGLLAGVGLTELPAVVQGIGQSLVHEMCIRDRFSLVLTNDCHQLAFAFPPGQAVLGSPDYTYRFVYYLCRCV